MCFCWIQFQHSSPSPLSHPSLLSLHVIRCFWVTENPLSSCSCLHRALPRQENPEDPSPPAVQHPQNPHKTNPVVQRKQNTSHSCRNSFGGFVCVVRRQETSGSELFPSPAHARGAPALNEPPLLPKNREHHHLGCHCKTVFPWQSLISHLSHQHNERLCSCINST